MKSSQKELLKTLDALHELPVLVIGDLILDRYIWGQVERISPEAPVPVVAVTKEEDRLGGAGNVAANVRSLGGKASVCGLVGDDAEGQKVMQLLEGSMSRDGVMIDRSRPTSLKTRVLAHKQQVVRVDRESKTGPAAAIREGFAAAVESQIESSRVVILSDYGKGVVSDALMRRLHQAQSKGVLGLGVRPLIVDPHPANYDLYGKIGIAKPNRKEAEVASGIKISDKASAHKAAQMLLSKWQAEMIIITLGEDGLLILGAQNKEPLFLETVALEVFDVSGAGDTVTALFAMALAVGASAQLAGDLANIGAGIVVSEVGTVSVTLDQLRNEIERLAK